MWVVAGTDVISQDSEEGSWEGGPFLRTESAPSYPDRCYDSADLRRLEEVTDDILAALVRAKDYPLEAGVTEVLRLRIAAAVFNSAGDGERDRDELKRDVLAQFHTPASAHLAWGG